VSGALKQIVATQYLPASVGVLYTAPAALANSVALLTSLVLANVTAGAVTITLYNVPSGGSPATSNAVMYQVSIPANTTWIGRYPGEGALTMPGGSTLQGLASAANSVTITAGGEEYV